MCTRQWQKFYESQYDSWSLKGKQTEVHIIVFRPLFCKMRWNIIWNAWCLAIGLGLFDVPWSMNKWLYIQILLRQDVCCNTESPSWPESHWSLACKGKKYFSCAWETKNPKKCKKNLCLFFFCLRWGFKTTQRSFQHFISRVSCINHSVQKVQLYWISKKFGILGPGRPSAGGPRMDRRVMTSLGVLYAHASLRTWNHEKPWKTMKNHEKPTWNHEKPWKTNLEPWKTMNNHEQPTWNHEKPWKTMKNLEKPWKNMKNHEKPWKTIKKTMKKHENHEKP